MTANCGCEETNNMRKKTEKSSLFKCIVCHHSCVSVTSQITLSSCVTWLQLVLAGLRCGCFYPLKFYRATFVSNAPWLLLLPPISSHPLPVPLVLIFFPTGLCFIPMSFFSYFFPVSLQAVTCCVYMIVIVTSHQLTVSPGLPSEGSHSPSKPSRLLFSPFWSMSYCSDPCSPPKEASFY